MKLYLFEYLSNLTTNYHSGGGLVVVAANVEEAKSLLEDNNAIEVTEEDWFNARVYELASPAKAEVFEFPDAGCC